MEEELERDWRRILRTTFFKASFEDNHGPDQLERRFLFTAGVFFWSRFESGFLSGGDGICLS